MIKAEFKPTITLIIFLVIAVLAIIFLKGVLAPFFIALLLTYILYPLLDKISKKFNFSFKIITVITSVILLSLILLIPVCIIPLVADQVKSIVTKIPEMINMLNKNIIIPINHRFGTHIAFDMAHIKKMLESKTYSLDDLNKLSPLAKNSAMVLESVLYTILIPLVFFYSTVNWKRLIRTFANLIPTPYLDKTKIIFKDIDKILSSYLRGQLAVMLIMAIIYALGLNLVGLPGATIIGIITGFLVFIPYIGFLFGVTLGLLMGISQFEGVMQILLILLVFGIGNIIENFLATPYLVGNSIGLNPVMIILSLLILGELFGILGIIFSLPLTAILVVLIKHWHSAYLRSAYYTGSGKGKLS